MTKYRLIDRPWMGTMRYALQATEVSAPAECDWRVIAYPQSPEEADRVVEGIKAGVCVVKTYE